MKKSEYLARKAAIKMAAMKLCGTEYTGKSKVSRQPKPTPYAWDDRFIISGARVCRVRLSQAARVVTGVH